MCRKFYLEQYILILLAEKHLWNQLYSDVASSISEGDIFIYSCSAQLIHFEIESVSKDINCAEHEYMNMSPPLVELARPLQLYDLP